MKTLRHLSQIWLFALAALLGSAANAQEFKIGFVNTDRIFREASTAKAAQVKLEQEFSKREKELVDLENKLKEITEQLSANVGGGKRKSKRTKSKRSKRSNRSKKSKRKKK